MNDNEKIVVLHFPAKEIVSAEIIEKKWNEIGEELKNKGYKVGAIQRPIINAYILPKKHFEKTLKKFLKNPSFKDESETEYGDSNGMYKTSAFLFLSEGGWMILKCEGINTWIKTWSMK